MSRFREIKWRKARVKALGSKWCDVFFVQLYMVDCSQIFVSLYSKSGPQAKSCSQSSLHFNCCQMLWLGHCSVRKFRWNLHLCCLCLLAIWRVTLADCGRSWYNLHHTARFWGCRMVNYGCVFHLPCCSFSCISNIVLCAAPAITAFGHSFVVKSDFRDECNTGEIPP